MAYHSFEDLEVWQISKDLAVTVCKLFRKSTDYGFRNQITGAAISVPSNIAEGAERNSNAEFKQFLGYSKGSSGEVRTQLYIARDLETIDHDEGTALISEYKKVSAMLHRLMTSLE